ncbi:hypothetical protein Tco_0149551 [Tanacetum coccineum]
MKSGMSQSANSVLYGVSFRCNTNCSKATSSTKLHKHGDERQKIRQTDKQANSKQTDADSGKQIRTEVGEEQIQADSIRTEISPSPFEVSKPALNAGSDQEGAKYCTISGTPGETREILIRRVLFLILPLILLSFSNMTMEVNTRPSSPTLMISAVVLEPLVRRRIREPRLRGVLTRFEYLSEDADEEIQMEGPPRFHSHPQTNTKNQGTQNIPLLLAAHLCETERRRRRLSPIHIPVGTL